MALGTYLGSKVCNNSKLAELRARMLTANPSFCSLELGIYSTYIVPVLTYASETWTLSKSDETLLGAFKRKMLSRILGPVCVGGQWRSRYSDELYEMYGDLTVVLCIKLARLRWAGHVVRMETEDPARKVFTPKRPSKTTRGSFFFRSIDTHTYTVANSDAI